MLDMLKKIDKIMRTTLIIAGSVFLVFKLLGNGKTENPGERKTEV